MYTVLVVGGTDRDVRGRQEADTPADTNKQTGRQANTLGVLCFKPSPKKVGRHTHTPLTIIFSSSNSRFARAFASSVLPTPVGPRNRKLLPLQVVGSKV